MVCLLRDVCHVWREFNDNNNSNNNNVYQAWYQGNLTLRQTNARVTRTAVTETLRVNTVNRMKIIK